MKQHNQIGKYTKKEELFLAKKGKTFVTPKNKTYEFDYEKISTNKYHIVVCYLNKRWRMSESDFNRANIDEILESIEKSNF